MKYLTNMARFVRPLATTTMAGNVPWRYAKLTHRSLLRIRGRGSLHFLQGIVTNDTRQLAASSAIKSTDDQQQQQQASSTALYSMMLNTQGRLLYDLILYARPPTNEKRSDRATDEEEEEVLIECDRSVLSEVTKQLTFYRLRRKLLLEPCDKEFSVFALFSTPIVEKSTVVPEFGQSTKPLVVCPDPRVRQLGFRAILETNSNAEVAFGGREADEDEYHALRYRLGIGEGCGDMPPGAAFPLEANGDYMNGVSFNKGCYVGQELTARTHHTGVIRKRLMPLKFASDASKVLINAKIVDEKGKTMGKFRRALGEYGLGLLYVREALAAKSLFVQREDTDALECQTEKPNWWPETDEQDKARGIPAAKVNKG